jgi:glycosyltransferase involved in cell wall biosynthesis
MRILFLSAWYPFPPDNGSKIRVYNLLRTLKRKHQVTLLAFLRPGDAPLPSSPELCDAVEIIPWQPFEPNRLRASLGFFSPTPRSLGGTFSPAMQARVREVTTEQTFDVVIASTIEMAPYALTTPPIARILEEHNFTTRLMREQFQSQKHLVPRGRYWLTWAKYRAYEARLYNRFDAVTMVSDADARAVRAWFPLASRLEVVPNGIDLREYGWDDIMPARHGIIFAGGLTYSANLDAIRYFLAEIWHRILAKFPEGRLKITGRYDGVDVDKIVQVEGVELTGYLDDIRRAIRESAVCVVPLRIGGGTRLKILEAMALGTPVISSSKGAEGLEVTHGENILIADDPAQFAAYTCDVLENPDLRTKLRNNARQLVLAKYDWELIGRKFEVLLEAAVSRRTM